MKKKAKKGETKNRRAGVAVRFGGGLDNIHHLTSALKRCKLVQMRRTVDLDAELEADLAEVVSLAKEKPAVVIRQALRAGLPAVANRFQAPRSAGYFTNDYGPDSERESLESAMSQVTQQPER